MPEIIEEMVEETFEVSAPATTESMRQERTVMKIEADASSKPTLLKSEVVDKSRNATEQ